MYVTPFKWLSTFNDACLSKKIYDMCNIGCIARSPLSALGPSEIYFNEITWEKYYLQNIQIKLKSFELSLEVIQNKIKTFS